MEEEKGRRRHGSQSAQPNPGPATRPAVSRPLKHGKESEDNSDDEFEQMLARKEAAATVGLHIMPGAEPEIADDGVDVSAGPPTFGQVVSFMLPTLGMLLANPILSMVDTSFVGRYNDKMALGALAPSTAACDQAVYLASFISVATTNLFADAMARKDIYGARRVVASTLTLAVCLGVTLGFILGFGGESVMLLLAGEASRDVIPLALKYVYVRAIGASFSLVSIVAQSACIGARDSVSPLVGVFIQSIANVVGDYVMVGVLGWGVAGAAWATIAAQVFGSIYLCSKISILLANLQAQADATGPQRSASTATRDKLYCWGLAAVPTKAEIIEVSRFCGPLFLIRLGVSYYWSSCAYAAAAAGTVSLASHQVLIGMFWLFTMGGEAMSVSAQAYFPAFKEKQRVAILSGMQGRKETKDVTDLFYTFLRVSGVMAVLLSFSALLMAGFFAEAFSSDILVVGNVRHTAILLAIAVFPNCPCIMIEGVLISSRDIHFLGYVYMLNAVVWTLFLSWMRQGTPTLDVLYTGLVTFQSVRLVQWLARIWYAGPQLGVPVFGRSAIESAKPDPAEMKLLSLESGDGKPGKEPTIPE